MDAALIDALRSRGRPVAQLPEGAAWLLVEFGSDSPGGAAAVAATVAAQTARPHLVVADPAHRTALWRIREAGAGLVTRLADGAQAWPGWEDATVPPERLGDYLRGFADLLAEHGRRGSVYGHFGEGCIHVRLDADLLTTAGRRDFRRLLEQAADLVVAHDGSLCGEHGDGRARSELLPRMYPREMLDLFARFKDVFDPHRLLNPGVLVDPAALDANLRAGRERPAPVSLALTRDGGSLAAATRRCVGVGACRQLAGPGVMCPSFQVTREEKHSTRGRAHLLAEMLSGDLVTGGWRSPEVHEALDLCLACKACASDCRVSASTLPPPAAAAMALLVGLVAAGSPGGRAGAEGGQPGSAAARPAGWSVHGPPAAPVRSLPAAGTAARAGRTRGGVALAGLLHSIVRPPGGACRSSGTHGGRFRRPVAPRHRLLWPHLVCHRAVRYRAGGAAPDAAVAAERDRRAGTGGRP
jgi:ferredoxin